MPRLPLLSSGMGRLGGRELATVDADVMFVCEPAAASGFKGRALVGVGR